MKKQSVSFAAGAVILTILLIQSGAANATAVPTRETPSDVEVICFAEQPAIVEGETVTLQAWATTLTGQPVSPPISFEWEVSAGRIEAQAATTQWDLSAVKVEPPGARRVSATVKALQPGGGEVNCVVEVFVGKKEATIPDRGSGQGESLLSARHFLLPGQSEAAGYGLYSYLLFSAPPKDEEEKARYLKTIEASLSVLQDVDDYLSRHVRPKKLNITYIPLKETPTRGKSTAEWATNLLSVYDYATAQILLNKVQQAHQEGPYLVSVLAPLSDQSMAAHLWENLTGIVPELAWDWIKFFTYLAAQQRSWSDESLKRFGLNLRNLIAVGGKVTPTTMKALQTAIEFKPKM